MGICISTPEANIRPVGRSSHIISHRDRIRGESISQAAISTSYNSDEDIDSISDSPRETPTNRRRTRTQSLFSSRNVHSRTRRSSQVSLYREHSKNRFNESQDDNSLSESSSDICVEVHGSRCGSFGIFPWNRGNSKVKLKSNQITSKGSPPLGDQSKKRKSWSWMFRLPSRSVQKTDRKQQDLQRRTSQSPRSPHDSAKEKFIETDSALSRVTPLPSPRDTSSKKTEMVSTTSNDNQGMDTNPPRNFFLSQNSMSELNLRPAKRKAYGRIVTHGSFEAGIWKLDEVEDDDGEDDRRFSLQPQLLLQLQQQQQRPRDEQDPQITQAMWKFFLEHQKDILQYMVEKSSESNAEESHLPQPSETPRLHNEAGNNTHRSQFTPNDTTTEGDRGTVTSSDSTVSQVNYESGNDEIESDVFDDKVVISTSNKITDEDPTRALRYLRNMKRFKQTMKERRAMIKQQLQEMRYHNNLPSKSPFPIRPLNFGKEHFKQFVLKKQTSIGTIKGTQEEPDKSGRTSDLRQSLLTYNNIESAVPIRRTETMLALQITADKRTRLQRQATEERNPVETTDIEQKTYHSPKEHSDRSGHADEQVHFDRTVTDEVPHEIEETDFPILETQSGIENCESTRSPCTPDFSLRSMEGAVVDSNESPVGVVNEIDFSDRHEDDKEDISSSGEDNDNGLMEEDEQSSETDSISPPTYGTISPFTSRPSRRAITPPAKFIGGSVAFHTESATAPRVPSVNFSSLHKHPSYPSSVTCTPKTSGPSGRRRSVHFTHSVRYTKSEDGTKTINEYILLNRLGKGAFGKVFLGMNKETEEMIAIKTIKKSLLSRINKGMRGRPAGKNNDSFMVPIQRELAILKKVDHPNIVNLIEFIDDPSNHKIFMIFEYVEGGPVMRMSSPTECDRPAFSENLSRKYFRDLIIGLEYIHRMKIVHRDIKNLLLDEYNRLKITDFGVSSLFQGKDDVMHSSAGTPAFLAPEACRSGSYAGKPADIWAAGITLYIFMFGKVPFFSPGIMGIYYSIMNDELEIPPDRNPTLADLLQRMLEKDSEKRITMEEILVHPWVTVEGTVPMTIEPEFSDDLIVNEEEVNNAIVQGEEMKLIEKFVLMAKMKGRLEKALSTARERIKNRRTRPMSAMYHRSRVMQAPIQEETGRYQQENHERISSAPHPLLSGFSSTTIVSSSSSTDSHFGDVHFLDGDGHSHSLNSVNT